jgi:hypothetical protein
VAQQDVPPLLLSLNSGAHSEHTSNLRQHRFITAAPAWAGFSQFVGSDLRQLFLGLDVDRCGLQSFGGGSQLQLLITMVKARGRGSLVRDSGRAFPKMAHVVTGALFRPGKETLGPPSLSN